MKLPANIAKKTALVWNKISSERIFVVALCCFPAFLFQRNVLILTAEAVLFFLLAFSRRGKIRLLPSLLMIAAVTFFSLLVPYGKVLWRFGGEGGFAITAGALEGGLRRGIMLAGMVFLSQLAISMQLQLPGKIGNFTALVFFYIEQLGKEPPDSAPKKLIGSLDQKLLLAWQQQPLLAAKPVITTQKKPHSLLGNILIIILPVILYGLLIFSATQGN